MGVLTDDDGLVDAALAEILALPIEKRHERDPQRDVDYLLTQYHVGQVSDGTGSTRFTPTHHFLSLGQFQGCIVCCTKCCFCRAVKYRGSE